MWLFVVMTTECLKRVKKRLKNFEVFLNFNVFIEEMKAVFIFIHALLLFKKGIHECFAFVLTQSRSIGRTKKVKVEF